MVLNIESINLLCSQQNGFRSGHSCLTRYWLLNNLHVGTMVTILSAYTSIMRNQIWQDRSCFPKDTISTQRVSSGLSPFLEIVLSLSLECCSSRHQCCPSKSCAGYPILFSSISSHSSQIDNTLAGKARRTAAWVLSVFHTRIPTIMLTLYISMVRSLLE